MSTGLRSQPGATFVLFAPALLIAAALLAWPFANGLRMSFTDAAPSLSDWQWVGLDNYAYVLADRTFHEVLGNSVLLIGLSVGIASVLGFALALLLNEGLFGTRLYRSLIFQGWVVPWIAVAVLWGWLFNFDHGIVNHLLVAAGVLAAPQNWMADAGLARTVLVSGFVWRIVPFMMVMHLAALQGVPTDLIEAARVDGAGYWKRLWFVVLPLVRNVMIVAALLQSVRLFQEITLPLVATQGGPVNATTTVSLYTYRLAFQQWDFGLAGAVGVVWSLALVVFAIAYVRFADRAGDRR